MYISIYIHIIWRTIYVHLYHIKYSLWHVGCHFLNLESQSISNFLGLFCHVPLKRDQWDWDWRFRLNDTPNSIGCTWNTNHRIWSVISSVSNPNRWPSFSLVLFCYVPWKRDPWNTNYRIWSVISSVSNPNRWPNSLGLFCYVPWKRDP